jgi:3-oxoadipate enol-lactonase
MPHVETPLGNWYYEDTAPARERIATVCLHGLLFDGRQWDAQREPLAALGRTIVFDGPGHGRSADPPEFTLEEHADALGHALDRLGVERAVLVGLSWGGMLSMRFALRHRERVAGLALVDTSAEAERLALRLRYRAFAVFHEKVGMPYSLYEREIAPKMFAPSTLRERPDLVARTGVTLLGFSRRGIARAARAVVVDRGSVLERLGAIRVPALVVCGEHDRATSPEHSRRIAEALGGPVEHVSIADAGHMTALERPDELNAALVPFVSGVLASAGEA